MDLQIDDFRMRNILYIGELRVSFVGNLTRNGHI